MAAKQPSVVADAEPPDVFLSEAVLSTSPAPLQAEQWRWNYRSERLIVRIRSKDQNSKSRPKLLRSMIYLELNRSPG